MKKINLTIAIFMLVSSIGFSQHFDVRGYGGFNILQLSTDQDVTNIDNIRHLKKIVGRPGVQFGAAATFGTRFYVQPGIQYSTLTTEIVNENSINGEKFVDQTVVKTISVPLKVGFRLINPDDEDFINVRVFGGFDGSHVLSVDHSKRSGKLDDLEVDDFSNMIVSADFGLGIDVLFLYVDLGYQLGLSPVYSGGNAAKANAFYTNLGIRISL